MTFQAILTKRLFSRVTLAMILAILTMLTAATGAGAAEHNAATPVTVTFKSLEELDPGQFWTGADGVDHLRGQVTLEEVSGAITGMATNTINGDFLITGECTEDDCEGIFFAWLDISIESEGGSWTGRAGFISDETDYVSIQGQLVGHGAYAGQRVVLNEVIDETDEDITLTGYLLNNAGAKAGANILWDACITGYDEATGDVTVSGGFLMSGPAKDSGAMNAVVTPVGIPDTAVVYGDVTFSGAHGELYGAFIAAAVGSGDGQEFGTFVLLGGTGAYEGVYGFGKAFETVGASNACDGVQGQWIGESFS